MRNDGKIRLGITMGDPAGIGPEILLQVLREGLPWQNTEFIIYGNPHILKDTALRLDCNCSFVKDEERRFRIFINQREYGLVDATNWGDTIIFPGVPNPSTASGILRCIDGAVMDTLEGSLQGIVTCPLSKEVIRKGGYPSFTGHTEYLGKLTGASHQVMMLATDSLRVVLTTTHVPFRDIISNLTEWKLIQTIVETFNWFLTIFREEPRLAITALNPHGGEGGTLGEEEETLLNPVLMKIREHYDIDVAGPLPSDTIFRRARQGDFDIVIALYHDQGMIAIKSYPQEYAVNVTLGLPIIRTSVDHGTAFDIAGKGRADATSLRKAIDQARQFAIKKFNL